MKPAYLYFITCGGDRFCKIGVAKEPRKRLETLQIGNPFLLELVGAFELQNSIMAKEYEFQLHQKFSHLRERGEWFRMTKGIWDLINHPHNTYKRLPVLN